MLIRYEVTLDDVVALYRHRLKSAPEIKRSRRKTYGILGFLMAVLLVYCLLPGGSFFPLGIYEFSLLTFMLTLRWSLSTSA